jgi:uncharacterized integral membrane protein
MGRLDNADGATGGRVVLRQLRGHWEAFVLVVAVVVFVAQNKTRVSVHLLWLHVHWPMWSVLAATAIVGALAGYFATRRRARG